MHPTSERKFGHVVWECKCVCGKIFFAPPSEILSGYIKSCGCNKIKYTPANMEKAVAKHLKEDIVDGTNLQVLRRNTLITSNTSGHTGVCWDKVRKKWVAQLRLRGKNIHLGRYYTIEEAIKARKEAEEKYFKPILDKYNKE